MHGFKSIVIDPTAECVKIVIDEQTHPDLPNRERRITIGNDTINIAIVDLKDEVVVAQRTVVHGDILASPVDLIC